MLRSGLCRQDLCFFVFYCFYLVGSSQKETHFKCSLIQQLVLLHQQAASLSCRGAVHRHRDHQLNASQLICAHNQGLNSVSNKTTAQMMDELFLLYLFEVCLKSAQRAFGCTLCLCERVQAVMKKLDVCTELHAHHLMASVLSVGPMWTPTCSRFRNKNTKFQSPALQHRLLRWSVRTNNCTVTVFVR